MKNICRLLRNGELGLYNQGNQLSLRMRSPRALVSEIASISQEYLTIKGSCLETLLSDPQDLSDLAEFAIEVCIESIQERKSEIKVHIDVSITNVNYAKSAWGKIANGLGKVQFDTKNWMKSYPPIFKDWHLFLCEQIGGWVGYPGYEWPRTEKHFLHEIVNQVDRYGILLGNQKNCKVYEKLAEKYPQMKVNIKRIFANFFELPN